MHSRLRPFACPRHISLPPTPRGPAGTAGRHPSCRRAAAPTRRPERPAARVKRAGDADQAPVAGFLAAALGTREALTLLLSTGVIGTRLPLEIVAAGIDTIT